MTTLKAHLPWLGAAGLGPRHSGGAGMIATEAGLRLLLPAGGGRGYRNAQIDDYGRLEGVRFRRRAPLTLSLRARFSHPAGALVGTAGFGLWNYPLAPPPALPQALWFFYASPPSDMALALDVPGHGWKAAAIDAGRPQALALLPLAPIAVPLMRSPALHRRIWPRIQRAAAVAEAPLETAMDAWHTYRIEWGLQACSLYVDDQLVLAQSPSPRGPLCFVAWVDNQYLVVTPQGRFGWGLLETRETQWLELIIE